jgi:Family of unknown function (DUF6069)
MSSLAETWRDVVYVPSSFQITLSRTRLIGMATAVLLAEVVGLTARFVFGVHLQAPGGTVAPDPTDITPLSIAIASIVGVLAGWASLACLERLMPHARRYWLPLALAVLINSLIFGPLAGTGVNAADRITLVLMHLSVALTLIGTVYRTWSQRLAPASPARGTSWRTSSHAAHRPPVHSDSPPSGPPLAFGVLYPCDDLVAVIDDPEQAHRAEAALHASGIPVDDSDVLEPTWVLAARRDLEHHRGWLSGLAAGLSTLASDDARYIQSDWREAERGHALVVVHAPTAAVAEQVRQVLRAHGGHGMRHYGRLAVTELPD